MLNKKKFRQKNHMSGSGGLDGEYRSDCLPLVHESHVIPELGKAVTSEGTGITAIDRKSLMLFGS